MTYSTSKKSTKYHLRPSKKSIKRRKSKFDSALKDKVLISDASIQTSNYLICHEEVNESLGKQRNEELVKPDNARDRFIKTIINGSPENEWCFEIRDDKNEMDSGENSEYLYSKLLIVVDDEGETAKIIV